MEFFSTESRKLLQTHWMSAPENQVLVEIAFKGVNWLLPGKNLVTKVFGLT